MTIETLQAWFAEHTIVAQAAGVVALLLFCVVLHFVLARPVLHAIRKIVIKSRATWDDQLLEEKVFDRLAYALPALAAYYGAQVIPGLNVTASSIIQRVAIASLVLAAALAVGAFLTALNRIYSARPENRDRPIKGYVQIAKILLYLVTGLTALAVLMDRSPLLFLSGVGAMTAVLLLIFRDTILSFVASIQISGNDMVRVGDWIEMPQFRADGDVIDVALHSVTVQNFDKTITTIPTHKLITDSFKNWRGMSEAGARRIKRSIFIDVNSIRFLEDAEVEQFARFGLLADYIGAKSGEIASHNAESARHGRDATISANVRRLTNIGTLRAYIISYLRANPKIDQEMTLIVRQRDPGPQGLPLEIYTFAADTVWANYEGIQADIFDHILAIVPEFGLRLYQQPSGGDFRSLTGATPSPSPGAAQADARP